jgi:hypothetical protein
MAATMGRLFYMLPTGHSPTHNMLLPYLSPEIFRLPYKQQHH